MTDAAGTADAAVHLEDVSVVFDGRVFGSRVRLGRYSMTGAAAVCALSSLLASLPADSGWPTLQLSR